ncbi:hypothetical protein LGT39_02275 [Demequina sp. TTPB684]|uniref:hypothetical protein n=1 Tax=unclassified Demequina TaxID=2620311 RepID=UPI001CF10FA0|nr:MULTISPECIES: hypothetical protein [unclassified Demequina]MCB2411673.1 hypothetical protein [Demequina sp. TTPB684]UPU89243.1 hypothetical protein LGT36_004770 [Demequina sp. TMPB413]
MLSSKYAPVIAIAVVAIMILGALGFFLAIKPQIDGAAEALERKDVVEANITQIGNDTEQIDAAAARLAEAPDLGAETALNAPASMDLSEFHTRLDTAVKSSQAEVVAINVASPTEVVAWTLDAAARPSTGVAGYFETGPVPRLANEPSLAVPYEPVVKPVTPETPGATSIVRMDVTLVVAGTPKEVETLLRLLAAPEDRLFQVFELYEEARFERDTPEKGTNGYSDGDVKATIFGALYLLNPDTTVDDEGELVPATLPSDSPFLEPDDYEPQVGAK